MRILPKDEVHFNKGDRKKYRKRLTYLVVIGAGFSIVTVTYGIEGGAIATVVVHLIRDIYWAWE